MRTFALACAPRAIVGKACTPTELTDHDPGIVCVVNSGLYPFVSIPPSRCTHVLRKLTFCGVYGAPISRRNNLSHCCNVPACEGIMTHPQRHTAIEGRIPSWSECTGHCRVLGESPLSYTGGLARTTAATPASSGPAFLGGHDSLHI